VKILLTTGIFPPDIGGPATFVPEISCDLETLGHRVTIITLGNKNELVASDRSKVYKISRNSLLVVRVIRTSYKIYRELKTSDAIFSNGLFVETSLALRFSRFKKNSVAKVVGDPVWERARRNLDNSLNFEEFLTSKPDLKAAILRRIYNWAWVKYGFITAPSLELCSFINSQSSLPNAEYIPNGVEIHKKSALKRDIDIICVARLVNWKNIDIAICAAADLDLSISIIGDGPERKKLELLAARLNAKANFIGQVEHESVGKWLERSQYFLLLSDYEGLSFALLEAMARGVIPVVSGNAGNLSVIKAEENGLVVSVVLEEVTSVLRRLESNPDLRSHLSRNAREHVREHFNGEIQRQKVISRILGK
jgi:glycosyltransferase involved in cell wall biosynthesis